MARKKPTLTLDGWQNILTAVGTDADKRLATTASVDLVTYQECENLWRGSDMGARIVERTPDEMLRQGWDVRVPSDKARQDAVQAQLEDLKASERVREALYYARAYGGGAVLVGADDGAADLSQPLGEVRSLRYLTALTPVEIMASTYYEDPREEAFGAPRTYQIATSSPSPVNVEVHESRLLVFQGSVTSRIMLRANNGWGDSIFTRIRATLRDFDATWAASAMLLQDFAQGVYSIKGLAEIIGSDLEGALVRRMKLMEIQRSTLRALIIDADEKFERQQTPMAGLPEMLEKWMFRLAAASEMPVSMLFGMAPAGLNATGDADVRFYYDHLRNTQDRVLRPALERLVRMAFQADGGGEPDLWGVEFRPLWQLTEQEQANLHIAQANADQVYLSNGVVSPDEVRASRFGGTCYSVQTVVGSGPAPGKPAAPPAGPPAATPTPPNGGMPDGTEPLEAVQGAGGLQP